LIIFVARRPLLCEFLHFAVVTVAYAQSDLTVSEADGSVSVCITISGASVLDRNVTVYVSIDDGTAMCESLPVTTYIDVVLVIQSMQCNLARR